jgi:predicted  nucleic acid-binding Zn-ribbon protein
MPHQCVRCKRIIPIANKELLEGCQECGGKFFFYIKEEYLEEAKKNPIEIPEKEKKNVEKDIRDIAGIKDENTPVILDIESVRAIGEGKFEIDIVNLFKKDRPIIYKIEEGKYIIDLSFNIEKGFEEFKKEDNL